MTNLRPEAVVVLPSLWLLASVFQNLWIPLVVLAAGRGGEGVLGWNWLWTGESGGTS